MQSPKLFTSLRSLFVLSVLLLFSSLLYSQSNLDSLLQKIDPQKLASVITKQSEQVEKKLVDKSMKVLNSLQKQEEKVYQKMLKGKDSLLAKMKLDEVKGKYASLKDKLTSPAIASKAKQYIPNLDSLSTSLKFLDENGIGGKVKDALAKTESLKDKFQQAEEIKNFIKERKEQLKQQFEKLGMMKQLKKINKEVYYYAAQIKEYKEILKDPKKIEKKAIELLSKTKLWKDFFAKNSMLASFFPMPGGTNNGLIGQTGFAGLQTRAQLTNFMQQSGMSGPNAISQLQGNISEVQSQLTEIRNKINQLGGSQSEDLEMPDFKPNQQKSKSFLKRLEYGTSFQSQKANQFFPVTTDVGLSAGYKLNDKSIIGIAASFKMGWGSGFNNIKLSSQGIGLRSFIDWKVKGSIWFSGGYEQNFRSTFNDIEQLRNLAAWQQSGLLGISKVVSLKTKILKKTKIQLLWDFLSYEQVPRTQPILFRVGYNF